MALIDRVKNILLTPKTEWAVIEGEQSTTAELLKGYALPLLALAAVCGFIGMTMIGVGMFGVSYRVGIVPGLVSAIMQVVLGMVLVVVLAYIIDALAPSFAAQKNIAQATKVAVYAMTAAWVGGVFGLIPMLAPLGILAALYSCYLLYLGLPALMKCPQDKAIPYTVVTIVIGIVLSFIVSFVVGLVTAGGMLGGMRAGGGSLGELTIDKGGTRASVNLDDFARKMEEAGKKMEAAQKSGKPEEAVGAAVGGIAAAFGGKAAEPVGIELLKPLVPDAFAGLPRKSQRAEKAGAFGFMVSEAEARYGDEGSRNVTLKITDTGGAAGLMALASWVQGEREDEHGREKTGKVDGRLTHEKVRKDGHNEFSVVIAERFVVAAKGAADINVLKAGVAALDLARLESMKDMGVKK
jgi:hypothetical protein